MKDNGVKEFKSIGINSSSGKEKHMRQVSPDRHPAIVSKNSVKMVKLLGIVPSPGK